MKFIRPKPQQVQFTAQGFAEIQAKVADYQVKRVATVQRLKIARELGDLSENGAYKAARFELSGIDRELRRLTYLLRVGKIVEKTPTDAIDFGSTIVVHDGEQELTFTVVSGYESNPETHKLSMKSPLGLAVMGKKAGDIVTVIAPAGAKQYKILNIL